MSELTLTSNHCVSCTVIHGLYPQPANFQVKVVLGIVSGERELDIHAFRIVDVTPIFSINLCSLAPSLEAGGPSLQSNH